MHVKVRSVVVSGIMLALTVLSMYLGTVIEMNTLFFLAAASFFVGIVFREFGKKAAAAFLLAGALLGIIVSPNKFYVFTYAAMGLYILIIELSWQFLIKKGWGKKERRVFWIIKYSVFNFIYILSILIFQEILFTNNIQGILLIIVLIVGQIGLFVYDRAYEYVQRSLWNRYRKYLGF